MLSRLSLSSFKCFQDQSFSLKPLTVLTGTNGTGKTSLIHALLLARQSARNPSLSTIELNGPDALSLGTATDVLHYESPDECINIGIEEVGVEPAAWSLRSPDVEGAFYLEVDDFPRAYQGILSRPAPMFSYLCAERLGPNAFLYAPQTDEARSVWFLSWMERDLRPKSPSTLSPTSKSMSTFSVTRSRLNVLVELLLKQ